MDQLGQLLQKHLLRLPLRQVTRLRIINKLKEPSQMRSILGKIRSTVMGGSFGNEKNHYQMNKIKARTKGMK